MKKIIKEFNIITGETTITEREETVQEKIEREIIETEYAKQQIETDANTATRKLLLERLGITEEEARLLLGGN